MGSEILRCFNFQFRSSPKIWDLRSHAVLTYISYFSRLVNKLGDPVRAVASKAIHLIGQLLENHPAMTPIVMEEIEHLLYRPNVTYKAQYYGICCLTQFLLDESRPEMANRLIKVYFSFFKASVKKGEVNSKMVT